jgi:DNA end-binding protein Ku
MPAAFWKGAINIGLVVIPVRMYVATRNVTPQFHLLHKKDHARVKQVLYCPKHDEYIDRKDVVRGYEYSKGKYVVLSDEDFDRVPVETRHRIDVKAFVGLDQIDPGYYYDMHYLEPEELGLRPYALLRDVLRETKRVAIGKVTFQTREHLCTVRPWNDMLVLDSLHYSAEIDPPEGIVIPEQKLDDEEVEMARTLVDRMTRDFDPDRYEDKYRTALQTVIQARLKGEEIPALEEQEPQVSASLVQALRESVERADAKHREKAKPGGKE